MHGPMNEGESATNVKMLWIISSGRSEIISNLIDYTAVVTDFPMAAPHYIIILSFSKMCVVEDVGAERALEKKSLYRRVSGSPLILTHLFSLISGRI